MTPFYVGMIASYIFTFMVGTCFGFLILALIADNSNPRTDKYQDNDYSGGV